MQISPGICSAISSNNFFHKLSHIFVSKRPKYPSKLSIFPSKLQIFPSKTKTPHEWDY